MGNSRLCCITNSSGLRDFSDVAVVFAVCMLGTTLLRKHYVHEPFL